MTSNALVTIDVEDKLPQPASGNVREIFTVDDNTLLFVATDRLSAHDVVIKNISQDMLFY